MSQYTRVNITTKNHVLGEVASIIKESFPNLDIRSIHGDYSEIFFEANDFDDTGFFKYICELFPSQEILFESSVELTFTTNKYINFEGKLVHIYFINNYPYYEDDAFYNIVWPQFATKK